MDEKSPYLKKGRLADVLAALQVMSIGERPEAEIDNWATKLSNVSIQQDDVDRWTALFREHPEFFWTYTLAGQTKEKAALRWRYATRLYDPINDKEYTRAAKALLPQADQDKLTGKPLDADAVNALMNTAIELHSRAIAEEGAKNWWIPLLAAVLSFVASLAGAYIGAHKG